VLLYECLCGHTPFQARNYNALMAAILSFAHRPIYDCLPRLDPELAEIVESCLIKDRQARTQSAGLLAEQLEAVALRLYGGKQRRSSDRLSIAPRASLVPRALVPPDTLPIGVRLWRFARRGPPPRVLALSGAIGGTALGLVLGVQISRSSPEPSPAAHEPSNGTTARTERGLGEPDVVPIDPPRAAPERVAAAGDRRDLVSAVARGLGIEPKRARRKAPPQKPNAVALAPKRRNPY
jgi:serine/threonine protein kinase